MDRKTLIARIRQLQEVDRNGFALYSDLSGLGEDISQRKIFSGIVDDEVRHAALGKKILTMLEM